uniref:Uncharacterized protein n=1 Tax=Leersia perrieri TaxID=77586 RepID=A0A0D9XUJ9_9ORYZ
MSGARAAVHERGHRAKQRAHERVHAGVHPRRGLDDRRSGRRGRLVLANAFLMAGALAMSLGATYAALMSARFVTSVGVGFTLVVRPVYNAEIPPASSPPSSTSMFVNVRILLAMPESPCIGVLPSVVHAAGVFAMRGRLNDARAVFSRVSDTDAEADLQLDEITNAVARRATMASGGQLLLRPSPSSRCASSSSPHSSRPLLLATTTATYISLADGITKAG